uniref:Uncharacterized protein n=1 Tax=Anabas testudineus TaxID=64144 RepID=A0A3Q1JJF8_ANATE
SIQSFIRLGSSDSPSKVDKLPLVSSAEGVPTFRFCFDAHLAFKLRRLCGEICRLFASALIPQDLELPRERARSVLSCLSK